MKDKPEPFRGFHVDRERVERAMRRAFRHVLITHKQAGRPIVCWKDGEIVYIPPEEIEIPELDEEEQDG